MLVGNPLWPGVDVRYTAMTLLAERAGYERYRDAFDMTVELRTEDVDAAAGAAALATAGGVQLHVTDRGSFDPLRWAMQIITAALRLWPDLLAFSASHFDKLAGTSRMRRDLETGHQASRYRRFVDS
jgi:hypothetical protein